MHGYETKAALADPIIAGRNGMAFILLVANAENIKTRRSGYRRLLADRLCRRGFQLGNRPVLLAWRMDRRACARGHWPHGFSCAVDLAPWA